MLHQRETTMIRSLALLLLLAPVAFPSAAAAQRQEPVSVTRFTRDPALLEAKERQILAAIRQRSPEAAAWMERLFARDPVALVAPELRRTGLDMRDLADMTATYWVAAWEASHGIVGRKTDPNLVRGARDQLARVLRADPAVRQMSDRDKQDLADTMLLQAILVEARMGTAARSGPAAQKQASDAIHAEASRLLNTDLRKVRLTTGGFVPSWAAFAGPAAAGGDAPPAAAANPAGAAGPAPHAANWTQVEGVYFRSYTGFGVGGMVIVDYEPLVLFRDGTYYEIEGQALEDVDLAASRRARPGKWGRWTRTADGITLTDAKGRSSQHKLQGGSFFKAFPAEADGRRLAARYKRVSGGGNSALGGELTIAAATNLIFTPDGRYMRSSSAGAVGSGDMTGVGVSAHSRKPASGVGRYRIERHTITLTEPDGNIRRQFFAFGSRKSPPQLDTDMIFLGNRVFITD